jgi:hypothetical protein
VFDEDNRLWPLFGCRPKVVIGMNAGMIYACGFVGPTGGYMHWTFEVNSTLEE